MNKAYQVVAGISTRTPGVQTWLFAKGDWRWQKVCDWLNANKLIINAKKLNFVIFRPSQKKLNCQINVRIYNNASSSDTFLECKDYVKFLGVLIDKNLTWKYHIEYIASKISRVVGIITERQVCLCWCLTTQHALFWNSMFPYARHIYQFCASEYLWSFYLFIWLHGFLFCPGFRTKSKSL